MLEVGDLIPEFELYSTKGDIFSSERMDKKQSYIFSRRMELLPARLKQRAFYPYTKI